MKSIKHISIILLNIFCLSCGQSLFANPDSLTMVQFEGQNFVVHMVAENETLYSISKRYNLSVENVAKANKLQDNTIFVGQLLRIPHHNEGQTAQSATRNIFKIAAGAEPKALEEAPSNHIQNPTAQNGQEILHEVKPKETLYSISRLYEGVSADNIKSLNQLKSDTILIGQVLEIPKVKWGRESNPQVNAHDQPKVNRPSIFSKDPSTPVAPGSQAKASIPKDDATELNQKLSMLKHMGSATFIQTPSRKANHEIFALHQTAPVGSWITVKNMVNGRSIKARVIGRFSKGIDESIILKLSSNAVQGLAAGDPKLMVEVQYLGE